MKSKTTAIATIKRLAEMARSIEATCRHSATRMGCEVQAYSIDGATADEWCQRAMALEHALKEITHAN